jgi:hypothetical protein
MVIRIQHGDVTYVADTPEEAVRIGALLNRRVAGEPPTEEPPTGPNSGEMWAMADESVCAWTPELFHQLIERLGEPQRAILGILVERRHVSDQYLREQLNIPGNQALAGALSGISKQAAALGISARSVFTFVNLRKAGKRQSTYSIGDSFRQIATEMGWLPGGQKTV